jgi:pyrimidine deaminase RibD-like protein
LFAAAKASKDPKGAVAACLVRDDEVIAIAASSDDGKEHAENILLKQAGAMADAASDDVTLYCTLEPCSQRSDPTMRDCVSDIIDAGVKHIVFGARDPKQSERTQQRLKDAGVGIRQTTDSAVIARCAQVFNESVSPERVGVDVDLKPEA